MEPDVQSTLTDDTREFRAPQTMTPSELGDNLARLVWESFSDFVSQEDVETPLPDVDTLYDDDGSAHRTTEEALIFFMWAHTRGAQLAFLRRSPDELIREGIVEEDVRVELHRELALQLRNKLGRTH